MLDLTELTALNDEAFAAVYSELKKEHKRRLAQQDAKRKWEKLNSISARLTAVIRRIECLQKNLGRGTHTEQADLERQRLLNSLCQSVTFVEGCTKEVMDCYGVDFDED